jgi:WD40 repeat protein
MNEGPRRGFPRHGPPRPGRGSIVPWAGAALGIIFFFQIQPLFSQQLPAAGAHRGAVRAILREGEKLYSAGDDGFLGIWDIREGFCEERFQISSLAILSMVKRPGKTEFGVIESDGMGLYRISVWDYGEKTKRFSLRFRDPLTYITWSAMGSFIIAARTGRTALVFIHPETGEILRSPEGLTGTVSFAATGPSERSMVVYQPQGTLSYWNLESGEEQYTLEVPPNLASPRIFGENRFFAGLDAGGLVILDAVSGEVVSRNREAYRFSIDGGGQIRILERWGLSPDPGADSSVTADAVWKDGAALGYSGGGIRLVEGRTMRAMKTGDRERIFDAAVSGPVLAFLAGDVIGFIPLDYSLLGDGEPLLFEERGPYHRLTGIPLEQGGTFLLWQDSNTRTWPLVRTSARGDGGFILRDFSLRFPLRTAAVAGDRVLFLDARGNVSVLRLNRESAGGETVFTYSSAGAMDAAFLEDDTVILGRSAVSGNTPFLMINTVTGETVPLPHGSDAGGKVYRGASGTLYGASVQNGGDSVKTTLLRIDPSRPGTMEPLVEFQGEDIFFTMAESGGLPASTIGGEGASIIGSHGLVPFERTPGFPIRLIDGGSRFVALDAEGNISWHDPRAGKTLALFSLYRDQWTLETKDGFIRGTAVFRP